MRHCSFVLHMPVLDVFDYINRHLCFAGQIAFIALWYAFCYELIHSSRERPLSLLVWYPLRPLILYQCNGCRNVVHSVLRATDGMRHCSLMCFMCWTFYYQSSFYALRGTSTLCYETHSFNSRTSPVPPCVASITTTHTVLYNVRRFIQLLLTLTVCVIV
jgi:hypothetical protein